MQAAGLVSFAHLPAWTADQHNKVCVRPFVAADVSIVVETAGQTAQDPNLNRLCL